jgi:hypothetical protein
VAAGNAGFRAACGSFSQRPETSFSEGANSCANRPVDERDLNRRIALGEVHQPTQSHQVERRLHDQMILRLPSSFTTCSGGN